VYKPARISKTGNAHLRRALFLPAMVASRWEPNVKAFYDKLLAKGKTKMQALIAVMRKLLHAIHGMLRHDQDFDGEKFFVMKG
jgi:transposase